MKGTNILLPDPQHIISSLVSARIKEGSMEQAGRSKMAKRPSLTCRFGKRSLPVAGPRARRKIKLELEATCSDSKAGASLWAELPKGLAIR